MLKPYPPRVSIEPGAKRLLDGYIARCPHEISGFGLVDEQPGELIVTEIMLLDQVVTSVETVLSSETILNFMVAASEAGIAMERVRFWWHSHATLPAYFSKTDVGTIGNFDTAPWWLSYVANHHGHYRARLDYFDETGWFYHNVAIGERMEAGMAEQIDADISRHVRCKPEAPARPLSLRKTRRKETE